MEICPEIVVLQSAFQLVQIQAGDGLPKLKKSACRPYTTISVTAIDEICRGLQCDNDTESSTLWEHRLHAILLHGLVQKTILREQAPFSPQSVPCLNAMDMIVGLLPTYSASLYFEVIKQKQWTRYFFQALTLLDQMTAAALLSDLMNLCRREPVTLADRMVIAMAINTFLEHCLYVPQETNQVLSESLHLLQFPRKHVCTLYPEATTPVAMETQRTSSGNYNSDIIQQTAVTPSGISFWGNYVESNYEFLKIVMEELRNCMSSFETDISSDHCLLGKIGLLIYMHMVGKDSAPDYWLTNNVFRSKISSSENVPIDTAGQLYCYMVNKRLAKQIAEQIDLNKLKILRERFDLELAASYPVVKVVLKSESSANEEGPLQCLMFKSQVFLRMIQGLKAKPNQDSVVCDQNVVCDHRDVVYGNSFTEDISMDALLWRIQYNLPLMQGCMDKLLHSEFWQFWQCDRLWDVLRKEITILAKAKRVMSLLEILLHYNQMGNFNIEKTNEHTEERRKKTTSSTVREATVKMTKVGGELNPEAKEQREVIHQLLELLTFAFQELSLVDQDSVVGQIHSYEDIRGLFPEIDQRELTHLFNKITSDMDLQVIQAVLLMCLKNPLFVIQTIVSRCVQNELQARSNAVFLRHLKQTCAVTRPDWPEQKLLTHVLHSFLMSSQLSDKQQKCFLIFLGEALQEKDLIDVEGVLQFVILPNLSTDILHTSPHNTVAMTMKMTLTLFIAILQSQCMKGFDWSNSVAEPMVLLVTLAGLLNECIVLWNHSASLENYDLDIEPDHVSTEMALSKLAVKELTIACLRQLQTCWKGMADDISINDTSISWLMEVLDSHHWTVRVRLAEVLEAIGFNKFTEDWNIALVGLPLSLLDQCQAVAISNTFSDLLPSQMEYENWLETLVLLLPQLLPSEVQNVFMYLRKLLNNYTEICWSYRTVSTNVLPCLDFQEVRSTLLMSQLLKDVFVTMTMTLAKSKVKLAMLQHSLRSYAAFIQNCCDSLKKSSAIHLFCLSELFHHACQLTLTLDPEVRDSVLVLVMHIVTRFKDVAKDVSMTTHSRVKVVERNCGKPLNSSSDACKYGKHLERGMLRCLDDLPDEYEEKHMMRKQFLVDG